MGTDRNALPEKRKFRQQRFNDPDVCKYYLVDFCPHDLFPNTRSDLGQCGKIHSDALKEQYQQLEMNNKFGPSYESDFISFLEKLIEQAEQKIEKANRRIDAPLPDSALLSEEQQRQVDQLHEEISKLLTEAEKAGERGDVEEAAVLTRQVQQLRKEADRASSSLYGSYMQREKSLRVCPICGAMQSVGDSMSRFESHVTGKQHQGFEKIRSCLEELRRRKAERIKELSNHIGGGQSSDMISTSPTDISSTKSPTIRRRQSPDYSSNSNTSRRPLKRSRGLSDERSSTMRGSSQQQGPSRSRLPPAAASGGSSRWYGSSRESPERGGSSPRRDERWMEERRGSSNRWYQHNEPQNYSSQHRNQENYIHQRSEYPRRPSIEVGSSTSRWRSSLDHGSSSSRYPGRSSREEPRRRHSPQVDDGEPEEGEYTPEDNIKNRIKQSNTPPSPNDV